MDPKATLRRGGFGGGKPEVVPRILATPQQPNAAAVPSTQPTAAAPAEQPRRDISRYAIGAGKPTAAPATQRGNAPQTVTVIAPAPIIIRSEPRVVYRPYPFDRLEYVSPGVYCSPMHGYFFDDRGYVGTRCQTFDASDDASVAVARLQYQIARAEAERELDRERRRLQEERERLQRDRQMAGVTQELARTEARLAAISATAAVNNVLEGNDVSQSFRTDDNSLPKVDDLIKVDADRKVLRPSDDELCSIAYDGTLVVKEIVSGKVLSKYFPPDGDSEDGDCARKDVVSISIEQIKGFNKAYLARSRQEAEASRNQVRQALGGNESTIVPPRSENTIAICSGPERGKYDRVVEHIQDQISGEDVKIIRTAGSWENLKLMAKGECQAAISQSDALFVYNEIEKQKPDGDPILVTAKTLYGELGHLICRAEARPGRSGEKLVSHIGDLKGNQLGRRPTVVVGPQGSGSAVTWTTLVQSDYDRWRDIEVLNLSDDDAMDALRNGRADCFFKVIGLGSEGMKRISDKADAWKAANPADALFLSESWTNEFKLLRNGSGERVYKDSQVPSRTYGYTLQPWGFSGGSQYAPEIAAQWIVDDTWAKEHPQIADKIWKAVESSQSWIKELGRR